MMLFWLICIGLTAIALAFVIPPLWQRKAASPAHGDKEANIEVYRDQLSELEADRDNGIISPEQYSIDGLAIITPDVMLALKAAAGYDIELIGDRIFIYGPIYEVKEQLLDMTAHLEAIGRQLMDNIMTYRDERLPYSVGRERGRARRDLRARRRPVVAAATLQ